MSLLVNVLIQHPETGAWQDVEQDTGQGGQGNRTLAGFEHCRDSLWGSSSVRALGCTLLPTLTRDNLFVAGAELSLLANECDLILSHLEQVATETGYDPNFVSFRTENIRDAVRLAQSLDHGMVVIW